MCRRLAFVLFLLGLGTAALADVAILSLGTWVQRGSATPLVMTVEEVGAARKLTYRARRADGSFDPTFVLTVSTNGDGKDAPTFINGKPTGESMAIKKVDALHTSTVLKRQGKEYGTSKAELSPDGKVMKVEDTIGTVKNVQYWDKK